MLRTYLTIISFLLVNIAIAQEWTPGVVFTNSEDTLKGLIRNPDNQKNNKTCFFKSNPESEAVKYSAADIKGYRYASGKYFVSKILESENNADTVFLEFLINGKANMYHGLGEDYYLEIDDKIYPLKNTKRKVVRENRIDSKVEYFNEKKEYIGVLNYTMRDAKIGSEIANTTLQPKSLIKLAETYHRKVCAPGEKCIVYERKISKTKTVFGFIAGPSLNQLDFGSVVKSDFSNSLSFGARMSIENFLYWNKKTSITIDAIFNYSNAYTLAQSDGARNIGVLDYEGQRFSLSKTADGLFNGRESYDVELAYLTFRIPIMINYAFTNTKLRPYIGAGFSNLFTLSSTEDFAINGNAIPGHLFGFQGRAGLSYSLNNGQRIAVEFNYSASENFELNEIDRIELRLFDIGLIYSL